MAFFRAGAVLANKFMGQGLGFPELAFLYALNESGGRMRKDELAARLKLNAFALDRIAINLTKIRAVSKETNKREAAITITESGQKLMEGALKLLELRSADMIPSGQDENLLTATDFLDRLGS